MDELSDPSLQGGAEKAGTVAPGQKVVTVHLQNIPLFKGLAQATLEKMAAALQLRTVPRGGFVLHKGASVEHLIFLLSGRLQVVDVPGERREIGPPFIVPGDYFGELAIIDGLPRSASVVACEASLVALLPRIEALEFIHHNPLVSERVLKRMASNLRAASEHQAILSIPNAFQRVFALLNQYAKTAPGGLVTIEKMPTQQEIAILVNTSRETVSRAIQAMIQKGIVEKDMRRLIIRHPKALRGAITAEQEL